MAKREIIKIDEQKCDGCGVCVPNCPEGAIQMIEDKARLVSDLYCDGLGACIGECPQGAISIEEREAEPYDEERVIKNIVEQGDAVIAAHLKHLKSHGETGYLKQAVDYLEKEGIEVPEFALAEEEEEKEADRDSYSGKSELTQWPVQIKLVPVIAPFFKDAHLLIAADCVPFAYAPFHDQLLKGKVLLVGCPKLDDAQAYLQKLTQIIEENDIKSITVAHMEVPCCFGLVKLVEEAIKRSNRTVPFASVNITVKGEKK
ncbi:MAG: ATP-binding protein [Actinomycetota bacterium]